MSEACRVCKAPIQWVEDDRGKKIPVDAQGVPHDIQHIANKGRP